MDRGDKKDTYPLRGLVRPHRETSARLSFTRRSGAQPPRPLYRLEWQSRMNAADGLRRGPRAPAQWVADRNCRAADQANRSAILDLSERMPVELRHGSDDPGARAFRWRGRGCE